MQHDLRELWALAWTIGWHGWAIIAGIVIAALPLAVVGAVKDVWGLLVRGRNARP